VAQKALEDRGITVLTKSTVTEISEGLVTLKQGETVEKIAAQTILWAAGVKASPMGSVLAKRTGVAQDRAGRVMVEADLSIAKHPNIFVIGDLANFPHQGEKPLPGIAPVAMQQGKYLAKSIEKRLRKAEIPNFYYKEIGNLSVIGQNEAVVDLGFVRLSGFFAWLIWVWAHIYFLIEFDNKLVVMLQWSWNYFTKGRGARLITGEGAK
jgi:NADH dehydrogenase